jgi:hypothetical protein
LGIQDSHIDPNSHHFFPDSFCFIFLGYRKEKSDSVLEQFKGSWIMNAFEADGSAGEDSNFQEQQQQ